ncbi:hypothetical protein [Ferrovibrio sp.]|uniref:hypothetical protein n=1 Tax=Ferrovibrio sp. TaxID=1917215 RepID=UPI0035AEB8BC
MYSRIQIAAFALILSLNISTAWAAPAALVEDASPDLSDPGAMDYLEPGRVIELKPGQWLVIGYMASCVQEEIRGGRVVIGTERSTADETKLKRSKVPCQGSAQLSQAQAGKSAAMVFRKSPAKGAASNLPEAALTLTSLSPLLRPEAAGPIRLTRLDAAEAPRDLPAGRAADLQKLGIQLAAGGLYRAEAGQQAVVFRIDPAAKADSLPPLSRLVRF